MRAVKSPGFRSSIPTLIGRSRSLNHVSARHANDEVAAETEFGFNVNMATLSASLQHYINSETPTHGTKIHAWILKTGFYSNLNIYIKLLILHLKCGDVKYARQVFDELPRRTLSAYNYMVSGYVKDGSVEKSFDMVRRMVREGEKPDGFTYSMVLKASTCESCSLLVPCGGIAKQVHTLILRADVEPDDVLYTALVNSYVKGGNMRYARGVFDDVLEKNLVCSTSMISGYMNEGLVDEAEYIFGKTMEKDVVVFNAMIEGYSKNAESARKGIDFFVDMLRLGFDPTISTFASVIGACSILAAVEVGQQVQSQLIKTKLFGNIKMGSALIDMFSKCGRIEEARHVFDQMCHRNVYTWTSMIDGYGKNGNSSEALELFSKMQRECSIAPNDVTFLSAISACGHAGLVTRGLGIFESMEKDFSIKPGMEHYACMVDLMGRAGCLNQAWEFVKSMPAKPNADVWAALLSSCRLHGNVTLADLAANELFKLNVDKRPGAYVAFSNTLAENGRWDNVSEIREMMKAKQIIKDTGQSWVGDDDSI
ncbi:unnamed protein product [Rhodiola kirilowii]